MKKIMNKRLCKVTGIIAAVVLLIVIGLLSVNIKTVVVTGSSRYTDQEMVDIIFQKKWDWNSVFFYIKNRWQGHRSIPFIEDYKIIFQGPGNIEIIVYEKSVVGYVSYMNSSMYFDKDGIIVESTSEKLEGVPRITGLDFGQIVLYQPLPVEDQRIFEEILNLTQILSVDQILVDRIHYNKSREATLFIGGIEVVLGDSANINGKIKKLNQIMPHIKERIGTLFLDTYDEANVNMPYTFKDKLRN